MIEPIRISFDVACSPVHAFEVWTARISVWWPVSHTATGDDGLEVVFEPRVGRRIFERTAGGREVDWGEVTVWDPPDRLGYLWHLRADRADATDVEIAFRPHGEGTRVEIVHRGWERFGSIGPARRDANRGGWQSLLPHFIEEANRSAADGEQEG